MITCDRNTGKPSILSISTLMEDYFHTFLNINKNTFKRVKNPILFTLDLKAPCYISLYCQYEVTVKIANH